MEQQHEFYATVKMYKTHLRRWGLWKHDPYPANHESSAIICQTCSPTELQREEMVYRALRDYDDGVFSMRRWAFEKVGPNCQAGPAQVEQGIKVGEETYVRFRAAIDPLERRSSGDNGGKAGDFTQGLMYITVRFRTSSARDFRPIEAQLLRHLYELTASLRGPQHPTTQLWRALWSEGRGLAMGYRQLRMCAAIALEQFSQHTGYLHSWTVELHCLAIGLLHPRDQGDPEDKTTRFRDLLQNLEAHQPAYDARHINTVCIWASHYRHCSDHQGRLDLLEEGISLLEGVLADPVKAQVMDECPEDAFNVYSLLAGMNDRLKWWDVAEVCIRRAINLARRRWAETGEEGDFFVGLNSLEIILCAQGKIAEADGALEERRMLVRDTLQTFGHLMSKTILPGG
ncbi:hypothetical protein MMYC01_209771 [Madurella mycetomatis]|uniref:Clr5 domain-containing protein n=1 Tax=Madurella mycetomatis TaxID=100816 RepID=A0A175VRQ4_9PEZI|nr:hypothetical protein MMYC01_209771 [Madurella mycetomatis]